MSQHSLVGRLFCEKKRRNTRGAARQRIQCERMHRHNTRNAVPYGPFDAQ